MKILYQSSNLYIFLWAHLEVRKTLEEILSMLLFLAANRSASIVASDLNASRNAALSGDSVDRLFFMWFLPKKH